MNTLVKIFIGLLMTIAVSASYAHRVELQVQGSYNFYQHYYYPADPRVPPPVDYYPGLPVPVPVPAPVPVPVYPSYGYRPYYVPSPGVYDSQQCSQGARFQYDSFGRLVIGYEMICH
jgi:hypothetical protein